MKIRRVLWLVILGLCSIWAYAQAEDEVDIFRLTYPEGTIPMQSQWGDTAAAVVKEGENQHLMIAEERDGVWQITVDNPYALDRNEQLVQFFLDSDQTLFWMYRMGDTWNTWMWARYGCRREADGSWGRVDCSIFADSVKGVEETMYTYSPQDGALRMEHMYLDEMDNIRGQVSWISVPGMWMEEGLTLAQFRAEWLSPSVLLSDRKMDKTVMERTSQELKPTYRYLDGIYQAQNMVFLMEREDGARVFVCVEQEKDGRFQCVDSAPLPNSWTVQTNEDGLTEIVSPSGQKVSCANVQRYADGTWGLRFQFDGDEPVVTGAHLLRVETKDRGYRMIHGCYPWGDVRDIDWTIIPRNAEELRAKFNTEGWATPNSPDVLDRLHLRAAPRKTSVSLGKYYNGTPVRVLERQGEYTKVSVCGVEGYMMTKYLAFGEEMEQVKGYLIWTDQGDPITTLYDQPNGQVIGQTEDVLLVIGFYGKEWLYVYNEWTGLCGYVRADTVELANG